MSNGKKTTLERLATIDSEIGHIRGFMIVFYVNHKTTNMSYL